MPVVYKIDILAALKDAGYNTNRLRKEKLLSEGQLGKAGPVCVLIKQAVTFYNTY